MNANVTVAGIDSADRAAGLRDPVSAKAGYYVTNCCGYGEFKWFSSVAKLIEHILYVEVPLTCLDLEECQAARKRYEPILRRVAAEGFTDELRIAFNEVDMFLMIQWWGSFEDLVAGKSAFSLEVLGEFVVMKGRGCGVMPEDAPDFAKFLRSLRNA